jgi:hypothetical protein
MDIKTALATIKTAISLAQTAKQAELLNQLIEVQQALLEAYDDAITIRSETRNFERISLTYRRSKRQRKKWFCFAACTT